MTTIDTTTAAHTVTDFAPVAAAITELVALAPHLQFPFGISAYVDKSGEPYVSVYGLTRDQAKAWGDFLGTYEEHAAATGDLHANASGVVAGVDFHAVAIEPVTA